MVMLEEMGGDRVLILFVEKGHRHCHRNYFVDRVPGEDEVRHL